MLGAGCLVLVTFDLGLIGRRPVLVKPTICPHLHVQSQPFPPSGRRRLMQRRGHRVERRAERAGTARFFLKKIAHHFSSISLNTPTPTHTHTSHPHTRARAMRCHLLLGTVRIGCWLGADNQPFFWVFFWARFMSSPPPFFQTETIHMIIFMVMIMFLVEVRQLRHHFGLLSHPLLSAIPPPAHTAPHAS